MVTLSPLALSLAVYDTAQGAARADGYTPAQDIFYLNKALAREYNAIIAYDFCVETGLFERVGLALISMIQNDHMNHRDYLRRAVTRLGGEPQEPPNPKEFYENFQFETVRTALDAFRISKRFEGECYATYAEIATYLIDPMLATTAGKFSAEELIHKALLVQGIASVPYDPSMRIRD